MKFLMLLLLASASSLSRTEDDLLKSVVAVIPTSSTRIFLAQASRSWRRGLIRAFIATNDSSTLPLLNSQENRDVHLEFYASVEDEEHVEGKKPHSKRPGDYRAALAPWLAHQHFLSQGSSYEYMLYGDDDTLWFPTGVVNLLEWFFPSPSSNHPPLAITDNLWLNKAHPHPRSARCFPCNDVTRTNRDRAKSMVQSKGVMRDAGDRWFLPMMGCGGLGCTPLLACGFDSDSSASDRAQENHPTCDEKDKVQVKAQAAAHGGAGIIFTSVLFLKIDTGMIKSCYDSDDMMGAAGGDSLLSRCLWRLNVSFSEPGYWIHELNKVLVTSESQEKLRWNHPDRFFMNTVVFDPSEVRLRSYLVSPSALLVNGQCSTTCRWLLRHAVSYHIKGRSMPSLAHAAALAWTISESHRSAHDYLTRLSLLSNITT